MKSIITTILILVTTLGFPQEVMLYNRKAVVKANMRPIPGWTNTVNCRNYLEYQKDSVAIGYWFTEDTLHEYYGRWICTQAVITMPASMDRTYIARTVIPCRWEPVERDKWICRNPYYDMEIERVYDIETVSYVFEFKEDEQ